MTCGKPLILNYFFSRIDFLRVLSFAAYVLMIQPSESDESSVLYGNLQATCFFMYMPENKLRVRFAIYYSSKYVLITVN
jgi:hypothetical protein